MSPGDLFFAVVPLTLGIGAVVAIVALFRRASDRADAEPGIGFLKQLYYYLLGIVALGIAASGATLLLGGLLDERIIAGGETELALALALTLVGTPAWLYLWALAQRSVREHPAEAGALVRKLYIYLALGGAAAFGAGSLTEALTSLLTRGFNLSQLALPLVMSVVWAFHWRSETREGQPTETARLTRRFYIYITAAYGLAMAGVGAAMALTATLGAAYDAVAGTTLLSRGWSTLWSTETREGASLIVVGGAWWGWHWLRIANADGPSELRHIYLYSFAAIGGAIAVAAALSIAANVLTWALDTPGTPAAATHFQFLSSSLTGLTLGIALWGNHAAVIGKEQAALAGGQSAARRVYRYLMTGIGVATLASGLVILLGTAIGILTPQPSATLGGQGWWKEPFAWGVSLALVGGLAWGRYWRVLQLAALAHSDEERGSQSRRTYLYAVAGVTMLLVLGNLSALLFILLRDLLEGEFGAETLHESKWAIGALLTMGVLGIYHWLTLRQDRNATDEEPSRFAVPVRRKSIVVVATGSDMARQLETRLGYGVRWWRAAESSAASSSIPEAELDVVEARIAEATGERVLVIAEGGEVRVVPYEA